MKPGEILAGVSLLYCYAPKGAAVTGPFRRLQNLWKLSAGAAMRLFGLLVLIAGNPWPALAAAPACPVVSDAAVVLAQAKRLEAAGQGDAAAACYARGLSLLAPADDSTVLDTRLHLARVYEELGAYAEAKKQLDAALPSAEKLFSPDGERTGDVLKQLGWVEYLLGRYADAELHLRRAQTIFQIRLGPRNLKLAKTLNSLGVIHRDRGNYERSQGELLEALMILRSPGTGSDDLRAVIHNNLAGLWYYRSDYRQAIEHYKAALAIFEKLYGENQIAVAKTLHNLGQMYLELGAYKDARTFFERALKLKEQLLGPKHASVGSTVNGLAQLAAESGDLSRAEALFGRAEAIYQQALGPEHPNVSAVLTQRGIARFQSRDMAAARSDLERALAIREKSFGPDSNWVAETLNSLGPIYAQLGNDTLAHDSMVRAIGIAVIASEQELLWNAYDAYAKVLARRGHFAASVFYGKYAVNVLQSMRNEVVALGTPLQISFLGRRERVYRDLASALVTLGRLAEAEQVLEMLKEEEYFDYVRVAPHAGDSGATRASFSASEIEWSRQLDAAIAGMQATARKLATVDVTTAGRAQLQTQNLRDRAAVTATLQSVSQELADNRGREITAALADNVPGSIPSGSAVLRYLVMPDRLRLIVTTQSGRKNIDVPVKSSRLNQLIFDFRQAVQNRKVNPTHANGELYRTIIAPVEKLLSSEHTVAIQLILDGALRYVPFAALSDGEAYLIERYQLSMGIGVSPSTAKPPTVAEQKIAGLGVSKAIGGFPSLPRVRSELERIVKRGPDDVGGVVPGVLVLDDAFTKRRLGEILAAGYPLVHIASHFVFRPGPLTQSYLLLGDGERLTLEQLKSGQLSLEHVDLLTLSACSTAVGAPDATGREFESFSVLAARLGAKSVISALWPVADSSTSILMARFYRLRQQGGHAAEALRQAQLSILRPGKARGAYSHPYYWAPFIFFEAS